ncbi:MAG: SIMPL domain-containing protein [Polyangiaceae bacterium]
MDSGKNETVKGHSTASNRAGAARLGVAAIVGLAIVASASVLGRSVVASIRIKHADQRISVTGSTTRRIHSDFVVWRANVKSQAPEMAQAYKKLSTDVPAVVAFVKSRGIDDKQIKVSAASIEEIHPRTKEGQVIEETTSAYVTEQVVEVSSGDIEKVEKISREATELIDRGVYIHSEQPLYIYTKLSELKVELLAEASKDARQRAEQIAHNAGSKVTSLLTARMGVMQVNPAWSTEVSGEGHNDKTTLDKDVLAIVSATFGVE